MHFAVTLNETLARLVDALVTLRVIFSYGTRVDRNQSDTGMMVPASGATGYLLFPKKMGEKGVAVDMCFPPPT